MATHSSTLAWKIPWTRSLVGYSPWGHKEANRTERLHLVPLYQYHKEVRVVASEWTGGQPARSMRELSGVMGTLSISIRV